MSININNIYFLKNYCKFIENFRKIKDRNTIRVDFVEANFANILKYVNKEN